MKSLPFVLAMLGFFMFSNLIAQTEPITEQAASKQKIQSQSDTREYPSYIDTGNSEMDNLVFRKSVLDYATEYSLYPTLENSIRPNKDIERWNKENPEISKDLKIKNYQDYKDLLLATYPPIPEKINTGDARADELTNKSNLKFWMEHHPDYPPYSDDMEALRKARLAFYDKYIKPTLNQ